MRTVLVMLVASAALFATGPRAVSQGTQPAEAVRPLQELERHHRETRRAQQQQFEATQQRIQPPSPTAMPPVRPGTSLPGVGSTPCIGVNC